MKKRLNCVALLMVGILLVTALPLTAFATKTLTIEYFMVGDLITKDGKAGNDNRDPYLDDKPAPAGDGGFISVGSYTNLLGLLHQAGRIRERDEDLVEDEVIVDPPKTDGGSDYSSTNTQVAGVDEPDIIKTDGKHIYYVADSKLHIFSAGQSSKRLKTLALSGYYEEKLLLAGDRLVVIGNKNGEDAVYSQQYDSAVSFAVYDVSNAANPVLVNEVRVTGSAADCRMKDGKIYFAAHNNNFNTFDYETGLSRIVPSYLDPTRSGEPRLLTPDKIFVQSESQTGDLTQTTVMGTIDVRSGGLLDIRAYYINGNELYMNSESIYITRYHYAQGSRVFRFAVNGETLAYAAGAKLPGRPYSRYAMDEYEGVFRIMTDDAKKEENTLATFDAKTMKKLGSINIAPGEDVKSARYMGDMAYVVTYRQVDPLFVIDLKNPNAPKVTGELKIPGFSSYLHPCKSGYLLGIGMETKQLYIKDSSGNFVEADSAPVEAGYKLTLFDVRDPKKPKEGDTHVVGDAPGYYDMYAAEHPQSIMVDAKKGVFAFPAAYFTDSGEEFAGGLVFEVNEKTGITKKLKTTASNARESRFMYADGLLYYASGNQLEVYDYHTYKKIRTVK
ncbi:beta-propeller domain-containing protein [Christensenellaceae bacterium OttesenSCG-928-M15]|nr:beta-propeller domain-containing protein [Christensenellaceae bacterium OttesenSCG-928-M15]